MKNYVVEQENPKSYWAHNTKPNEKGENIKVCIQVNTGDVNDKKSLGRMLADRGDIPQPIKSYLSCATFVHDTEDNCYGRYNPWTTMKQEESGSFHPVIVPEWTLENTEENREKLLDEVFRLFYSATGKTATEEKIDKIHQYAKERGLKVITTLPNGWKKHLYACSPNGAVYVTNGEGFKSKAFEEALLLVDRVK